MPSVVTALIFVGKAFILGAGAVGLTGFTAFAINIVNISRLEVEASRIAKVGPPE